MDSKIEDNLRVQVKKGAVYITVGKLITPLITFLTIRYIMRMLSVEDYGIYNLLFVTMVAYIGLFSSLGLPSIFQRYIPEFYELKDGASLKRLVTLGSLYRVVLSVLFVLLLILFSGQMAKLSNIPSLPRYFRLFALGIIFGLEGRLLGIALTSSFLHKYFVICNIAYISTRACMIYGLLRSGYGLEGLLVGEVGAFAILLAGCAYCFYSRLPQVGSSRERVRLPVKRLFRYGGFSFLNETGVKVLDVSTGFLIISIFLGPVAVGIYSFANQVVELFSRFLPQTLLQEIIYPTFFRKFTKTNDQRELHKMATLLIKMIAFFSLPLTFAIFVLGDKIILYVFDPKYISGLRVLWIVAAFLIVRTFQFPLGLVLQAIEKVNILLYSKVFCIYNLILNIIVVRFWGITGIAVVTGTAILFQNLFMYFFVYKYTKRHLWSNSLLTTGLNSIIMSFSIFWLRDYVIGLPSLIMISIFGLVIYLVAALVNKAFTQEERVVINSIIGRNLFVF